MESNDTIKALEGAILNAKGCDSKVWSIEIYKLENALDLINCLQAEEEELVGNNDKLKAEIERLKSCVKTEEEVREIAKRTMEPLVKEITREQIDIAVKLSKAEAYKECLAKVKNYIKTHCNPYGKPDFDYDTSIKILNFIDTLLKEMVGE